MKSLTLILLVGLTVALVCVHGAPANSKVKSCDIICTTDFSPVCGTDGDKVFIKFSNKCQMIVYNCKNDKNLVAKLISECPAN